MDRNELSNELHELAKREGLDLCDSLDAKEHFLRDLVHDLGAEALQEHVNQSKPGYEGSSRPCPQCSGSQRFVKHRPRKLVTMLGQIQVKRAYYHCKHCKASAFPWDQAQGIGSRTCSVAVGRAATQCTAQMPFAQAATMFEDLAGLKFGGSTLHEWTGQVGAVAADMEEPQAPESFEIEARPDRLRTGVDGVYVHINSDWREVKAATCYWDDEPEDRQARYRVRYENAEDFVPHVESLLRRCGHYEAQENVLLGDGAKWIWQRVGAAMDPQTVFITDWYHAMQHVWTCAKALHGEGTPAAASWAKTIETMLWEGRLRDLRRHLREQQNTAATEGGGEAIKALMTYVQNQNERLLYDDFRAAGYDIGSGRTEAACKHVVAHRAKRSGMHWSSRGFQAVMSLRCAHLNEQADDLWSRRPLARAA